MATPQTHISQLFLGVARTADLALLQTVLALFPKHRLSEQDSGVFWFTLIRALPTYAEESLGEEAVRKAFQHCEAVAGSPFLLYNPTLSGQVLDACSSTDWWEGLHKKSERLNPFATLVDFLMTHPEAVEWLNQQHQDTGYHPVVKALAKHNPTAIDFFVEQGGDLNALYSARPNSLNQEAASERHPLYAFATDQELSLKRLKRHGMDFSLPITLRQHTLGFEEAVCSTQFRKAHARGTTTSQKIEAVRSLIECVRPVSSEMARVLQSRDLRYLPECSASQWLAPFKNPNWNGFFTPPALELWRQACEVPTSANKESTSDDFRETLKRVEALVTYFSPEWQTARLYDRPAWAVLLLDLCAHQPAFFETARATLLNFDSTPFGQFLSTPEGLVDLIQTYAQQFGREPTRTQPSKGVVVKKPAISHQTMFYLVASIRKPKESWTSPTPQGQSPLDVLCDFPTSPFWDAPLTLVAEKSLELGDFSPKQQSCLFDFYLTTKNSTQFPAYKSLLAEFLSQVPIPSSHTFDSILQRGGISNPREVSHLERLYLNQRNCSAVERCSTSPRPAL